MGSRARKTCWFSLYRKKCLLIKYWYGKPGFLHKTFPIPYGFSPFFSVCVCLCVFIYIYIYIYIYICVCVCVLLLLLNVVLYVFFYFCIIIFSSFFTSKIFICFLKGHSRVMSWFVWPNLIHETFCPDVSYRLHLFLAGAF